MAASSGQGALGLGSVAGGGGGDGSGSQWGEDLLPLSPTCFDADQHWFTGSGGMSAVASCPALYFAGSDAAAAATCCRPGGLQALPSWGLGLSQAAWQGPHSLLWCLHQTWWFNLASGCGRLAAFCGQLCAVGLVPTLPLHC